MGWRTKHVPSHTSEDYHVQKRAVRMDLMVCLEDLRILGPLCLFPALPFARGFKNGSWLDAPCFNFGHQCDSPYLGLGYRTDGNYKTHREAEGLQISIPRVWCNPIDHSLLVLSSTAKSSLCYSSCVLTGNDTSILPATGRQYLAPPLLPLELYTEILCYLGTASWQDNRVHSPTSGCTEPVRP